MSETKPTNPFDAPTEEPAQSTDADSRTSTPPIPEEPTRAVVHHSPSPPPQTTTTMTTENPITDTTPTTTETTTTTQTSVVTQRESLVDPRVVALRALFPDYDDTVLQSVLASVNYDQDLAVETLLTMSDPEYKPETQPAPTQPLTQEQLDEEFARQLLIQEEHQYSQFAANRLQGVPPVGHHHSGRPSGAQPLHAQHPQQQPGAPQGQGQGMAEFQEQLNKFAESGKKTFGSIVGKVKAKIQEFEQSRTAPSTLYLQQQQQQQQQQQPQQWTAGPAAYYGPSQAAPQPSYSTYTPGPSNQRRSSLRPNSTSPTSTSPPPLLQNKPLSPSSPSQSPTIPPPNRAASPAAAQPIDGGKLGLLPKRPVSLIRDGAASGGGSSDGKLQRATANNNSSKGYMDDDDDDLEYAENPFEDSAGKKK